MKKSIFSKFVSVAAMVAISVFFLTGCAEDPAKNGEEGENGEEGGGGSSTIQTITIINNTGYSIGYIYVKPSTSTDWGSNLVFLSLPAGQAREFTLSKPLSANVKYDVRLSTSSYNGYTFIKYGVFTSNGILTFTNGDLTDESNLPSITIQNRTGVNFSGIYIRPSSVPDESSDWGKDYGSLSNNSDKSIDIPIPLNNYTTFDIQIRSSDPTNTYTKKNVTISNGTIVTYTSADSDGSLMGLPIIVIQNNTGYSIGYIYIKPPTSTDWGSNLTFLSLPAGSSRAFTLPQTLSANSVYDIRLSTSSSNGNDFRKYMVTVSEGMIITFTVNDLDNGSNLPNITIQNRSGVNFDAIHIKLPSSSDWGTSFGSVSNNYDKTVTIPIPPSNSTVFDIQMRSSNPTNTYTKNNVTVSNGMVLIYTSADSDNSLMGLPIIVIQNNTGYSIGYIYIKPPTSTDWGSNLTFLSLPAGESRTFSLSQTLSANSVYDIRLGTSSYIDSGNQFIKSYVSVSEGMIVTFTSDDLQ